MRGRVAALVLMTMAAAPATAQSNGVQSNGVQSNGVLGCDRKDADPQYCHDGKRRTVCSENGHLLWQDSRDALSQGEMHFLALDGRVPTPPCGGKIGG